MSTPPGTGRDHRNADANALEAARRLLALLDTKDTVEGLERRLRMVLDDLARVYETTGEPSYAEEYPEPARADYASMRARFAAVFPGLGPYQAVSDLLTATVEPEVTAGDALDDLTDIAVDLQEVLDRAEKSTDDAIWHFRFGYQSHWGRHLRWLQLVLYERGPAARAVNAGR